MIKKSIKEILCNGPENDWDRDKLCAGEDNCPYNFNPRQEDKDRDGIGDACDTLGKFNPGTPLLLLDK